MQALEELTTIYFHFPPRTQLKCPSHLLPFPISTHRRLPLIIPLPPFYHHDHIYIKTLNFSTP